MITDSLSVNDKPKLSVIITSVNGYRYIAECLSSIGNQSFPLCSEVIVLERSGDDTASRISKAYPWVSVIPVSIRESIPRLRSMGIRIARADIVVTTDDHCVFDADWFSRIHDSHLRYPDAVIGGSVENGSCERLTDWAAYFCDYGKFMRPLTPGASTDLPGSNVSYKKKILEDLCSDMLAVGVWENRLYERLLAGGKTLRLDPSIVAYHIKTFEFYEFILQRYYFGRSYAAHRFGPALLLIRMWYLAISLFLPPLLIWRYAKCCFSRKRFRIKFLKTLPLQIIFAVAWSFGEFMGYAFGDGGSTSKVK
jgi:glycosyltransferase involved in cell wall biosynthesis